MMYLEHFGLNEPPFRITPHPEFFYTGANRGATLEGLIYAITEGEGIVKVTGEVGSGKTMLCRVLMDQLPEHVETVYLANPSLGRDEILLTLAEELQVPTEGRASRLIRSLQEALVARYANNRQVVVLVDEAHAMPADTLEEIRLLSNLEHGHHKLLQIVLFAQSELNDLLAQTHMRQLKERITYSFELAPLKQEDTAEYLMFRMRRAGYKGPDLFAEAAVRRFAEASHGLTRRLNILADKALLAAYANNRYQVDAAEAQAAIQDCGFSPLARPAPGRARQGLAWGAGALALLASLSLGWWLGQRQPAPARAASVVAVPAPRPAAPASTPSSAVTLSTPAGVEADAGLALPAGALLQQREQASRQALAAAQAHWFAVQLMVGPRADRSATERALQQLAQHVPADHLFLYPLTVNQQPAWGVLYGWFGEQAAAERALQRLPASVRANRPSVRTVSGIRQQLWQP